MKRATLLFFRIAIDVNRHVNDACAVGKIRMLHMHHADERIHDIVTKPFSVASAKTDRLEKQNRIGNKLLDLQAHQISEKIKAIVESVLDNVPAELEGQIINGRDGVYLTMSQKFLHQL